MYDAFLGYTEDGKEIWVNYGWLWAGCINEQYFNWMYSMLTAQSPDIRDMIKNGSPYRKYVDTGITSPTASNDLTSHSPRFILIVS